MTILDQDFLDGPSTDQFIQHLLDSNTEDAFFGFTVYLKGLQTQNTRNSILRTLHHFFDFVCVLDQFKHAERYLQQTLEFLLDKRKDPLAEKLLTFQSTIAFSQHLSHLKSLPCLLERLIFSRLNKLINTAQPSTLFDLVDIFNNLPEHSYAYTILNKELLKFWQIYLLNTSWPQFSLNKHYLQDYQHFLQNSFCLPDFNELFLWLNKALAQSSPLNLTINAHPYKPQEELFQLKLKILDHYRKKIITKGLALDLFFLIAIYEKACLSYFVKSLPQHDTLYGNLPSYPLQFSINSPLSKFAGDSLILCDVDDTLLLQKNGKTIYNKKLIHALNKLNIKYIVLLTDMFASTNIMIQRLGLLKFLKESDIEVLAVITPGDLLYNFLDVQEVTILSEMFKYNKISANQIDINVLHDSAVQPIFTRLLRGQYPQNTMGATFQHSRENIGSVLEEFNQYPAAEFTAQHQEIVKHVSSKLPTTYDHEINQLPFIARYCCQLLSTAHALDPSLQTYSHHKHYLFTFAQQQIAFVAPQIKNLIVLDDSHRFIHDLPNQRSVKIWKCLIYFNDKQTSLNNPYLDTLQTILDMIKNKESGTLAFTNNKLNFFQDTSTPSYAPTGISSNPAPTSELWPQP